MEDTGSFDERDAIQCVSCGSLLGRFGRAVISHPGGCNIGKRPIDIHIKGLEQLGARVETRDNDILIKADDMKPALVKLDYPSVGATENILLAAVSVEGETIRKKQRSRAGDNRSSKLSEQMRS